MPVKKHHGKPNGVPTPEYAVWSLMRDRCNNNRNRSYSYYGGRGISVDKSWDDFTVFLADMGPRPDGATIDRIDTNKGYAPDNCRWATRKEQSRNRNYCIRVNWNGSDRYLWDLADEYGINIQTVHQRLHRKWTLERTLTQPLRRRNA